MDRERAKLSRRSFFRGAAQVSAIGAVASASLTGEADAYTPGGDEMRARYRVTDHVKAFYATNGYETKSKK
ncbi:MAG: formate dehydrogenase [Beijerinckiaceae bacterium]|nr:formate dehydrogenase [Beijerinckiaceae bacterium]